MRRVRRIGGALYRTAWLLWSRTKWLSKYRMVAMVDKMETVKLTQGETSDTLWSRMTMLGFDLMDFLGYGCADTCTV